MDYKEEGVVGVRIHRISRVQNRILRNRFEEALAEITDVDEGYMSGSKWVGKLLLTPTLYMYPLSRIFCKNILMFTIKV